MSENGETREPASARLPPMLPADICHAACDAKDRRFDGRFYVGVKSTGIYCRCICSARQVKRANRTFWPSAAAAEAAGFRPCLQVPSRACAGSRADRRARRARRRRIHAHRSRRARGARARCARRGARRHGPPFAARDWGGVRREPDSNRADRPPARGAPLAERNGPAGNGNRVRVGLPQPATIQRDREATLRSATDEDARPQADRARRDVHRDAVTARRLSIRADARLPAHPRARGRREPATSSATRACSRSARPSDRRDRNGRQRSRAHAVGEPRSALAPARRERARHVRSRRGHRRGRRASRRRTPSSAADVQREPGVRVPGALDGFECAVRAVLGQQVSVAAARTLTSRLASKLGAPFAQGPAPLARRFPDAAALGGCGLTRDRDHRAAEEARRNAERARAVP